MNENIKYDTKKYKIVRAEYVNEIRKIIYEFDNVFKPSLSKRIVNLDTYSEKLYKNAIVIAAIEENDVIGFIAFYANNINTHVAYLTQIAVKLKEQNRKIGKALLELCIKTSQDKGMTYIKLEVFNHNTKAIDFYEKYGFVFCGKASDESMYMIKKLK